MLLQKSVRQEDERKITITLPRKLDRRAFIGLGGLGVIGGLLVINSGGTSSEPARHGPTTTPISPNAEVKAKTPEDPLTAQAKERAINRWVELLSSERAEENPTTGIKYSIRTEVLTPNWRGIIDKLKKGDKVETPLLMSWKAFGVQTIGNNIMLGFKWIGEAEFTNMSSFTNQKELNSVERKDGYEWVGNAGLDLTTRIRSFYTRPNGSIRSRSFQEWFAKEVDKNELPDFGKPLTELWVNNVEKKNGQWKDYNPYESRRGELGKMELPTLGMVECRDTQGCRQKNIPLSEFE